MQSVSIFDGETGDWGRFNGMGALADDVTLSFRLSTSPGQPLFKTRPQALYTEVIPFFALLWDH